MLPFLPIETATREAIYKFYIRLKEQSQKCVFTDLNREIQQQVKLATCSNKLRRYSFQNLAKSPSELFKIAKSSEDLKIYVLTLMRIQVTPFVERHADPVKMVI